MKFVVFAFLSFFVGGQALADSGLISVGPNTVGTQDLAVDISRTKCGQQSVAAATEAIYYELRQANLPLPNAIVLSSIFTKYRLINYLHYPQYGTYPVLHNKDCSAARVYKF